MEDVNDIRATFFGECEEGLLALEEGLTALGSGGAAPGVEGKVVHAVFRAVHSIKGGAGAFGLTDLITFAHGFETLLDELRGGRLAADGDLVATLLSATDVLADLVTAARDGGTPDPIRVAAASASLAARLPGVAPSAAAPSAKAAEDEFGFRAVPVTMAALPLPSASWTVRFRPHAALYARGNETGLILRELARLGTLGVTLDASEVAPLDGLDLDEPRLRWTLRLQGVEEAVRTAFEWVEGDCDLTVEREATFAPDTDADIAGLLARLAAEAAPAATAPRPPAAPSVPEAQVCGAEGGPTIRVDLDRVDRLVDLVGELVIHGGVLTQRATEVGTARAGGLEGLERLTRDLQDSVMAIHAQPVRGVFQRMPRLVREVASRTGKRVRLVTEAENTEVDRTVIERLGEPLTHMIRNAVDHGIEVPHDGTRTTGDARLPHDQRHPLPAGNAPLRADHPRGVAFAGRGGTPWRAGAPLVRRLLHRGGGLHPRPVRPGSDAGCRGTRRANPGDGHRSDGPGDGAGGRVSGRRAGTCPAAGPNAVLRGGRTGDAAGQGWAARPRRLPGAEPERTALAAAAPLRCHPVPQRRDLSG